MADSTIYTEAENQAWAQKLPGKMTSACLIIRAENKFLMVKAVYKDHWTFPSGIVENDESPKDTALRETFEETGIEFSDSDCSFFSVIYSAAKKQGDRDRFNFSFIVDTVSEGLTFTIPNEEIESAEWVDAFDIAAKSGNKGSYIQLQNLLSSGSTVNTSYVEVR